ncbi:MAG: hypothetical protein RL385_321 [Pseudomonadota bacterium]|jgi:hypothetical protein
MSWKMAVIGSEYPQVPADRVRVRLVQCRKDGYPVRPRSRIGHVGENGGNDSDRLVVWFDFDDAALPSGGNSMGELNCNVTFLNQDDSVYGADYGVPGVIDFLG